MTELIWDGKYKDGKKVSPVKIALPFQTIETVNESVQERQKSLDLFASGRDSKWRNRLIWGDKKYVLPSLLTEFAGKVNLIYIDPPFDTGADFSFTATIPDNPETSDDEETTFTKKPSILEQKAYRDTWGVSLEDRQRGVSSLDRYLKWFHETMVALRDLLADNGSIYVHIGVNVSHYCKVILDEVFSEQNYHSEIVWRRTKAHNKLTDQYGPVHDVIFFYSKSDKFTFHPGVRPFSKGYIESRFIYKDFRGRYQLNYLTGPGTRQGDSGKEWRGFNPTNAGRHWALPSRLTALLPEDKRNLSIREIFEALLKAELIVFPKKDGGQPMYKQYFTEGVPYQDIWAYQPNTQGTLYNSDECIDQDVKWLEQEPEVVNFPTQKPEGLLRRIIETSSEPNDLILDCFSGGGTTASTAEKLNRRWIVCDLGRFAIHTTRKRLLQIPDVKPFVVQNLGKYERQAWQVSEFAEPENQQEKELRYRRFIVDLYKAEFISGSLYLHGLKNGRMVHVGSVDTPVTLSDVKSIAAEVWKSVGKGKDSARKSAVDILGWEFAFDLNESAIQTAAESKVDVTFRKIPREVLEKKAVEQGDIKFFELASLSVDCKAKGREVTLKLKDFVIPPDDVPEDVQKAISHWSQWIDYWAVDWDFKGDTFHNEWQSYRTRKSADLETATTYKYQEDGEYTILVKVIDILGNDTTKILKVKVK